MAKTKPFTVRLSQGTEDWLEREARRTRLSKGSLLEGLAEEGIRTRAFAGIGFRGPENDRRAWVVGTGLDVWEIVEAHDELGRQELLACSDLSARHVDLALAYHDQFPDEIDALVAENQQPLGYWQQHYPGVMITDESG